MPHETFSQKLEVLVVDDEADIRELLAEFCAARGFQVATAQDGRAAVHALERANPPFPVVIADLHLPHADGFAVLEAARRASASCYVIIVTGYATIDGAVRAVQAGALRRARPASPNTRALAPGNCSRSSNSYCPASPPKPERRCLM